jgi:hypothetical protein
MTFRILRHVAAVAIELIRRLSNNCRAGGPSVKDAKALLDELVR